MVYENMAGDRNQRHARGMRMEQLDGVEPAEAGHEHVEHHHVESRARECLDSLRTILGKDDVKAFVFEPASE
jgi:hypothetical protein